MAQKKVAAIHDLSCVGRCSLTVALPILSAAGFETGIIPTAVLSTHTGGFSGYTYLDLTEEINTIKRHFKSLGLKFDAVYTGFLGSFEQLSIVSNIIDDFSSSDNIIMIDPVMADAGRLYSVFDESFPNGMRKLCQKGDIILPNMTEAAFLLGKEYKEGPYEVSYIESLIDELSFITDAKIVLTGVHFDDINLGAAVFDKQKGKIEYAMNRKIAGFYHGTGDVFASALLGAVLNGFDLFKATQIAEEFTVSSIEITKAAQTDVRYGVAFEKCLPQYIKNLNLI